jgi:hypothetical protein
LGIFPWYRFAIAANRACSELPRFRVPFLR